MSVWNELKRQTRITNDDLLMPPIEQKVIVKVDNILPPETVTFDIETGSVADMWKADADFIRLTGFGINDQEVHTTESAEELVMGLQRNSGWVIGHNILNYDLILLERFFNLNILELAKKDRIRDTKLLAFLADPPLSRTKEGEIERIYSLENQGQKYLGIGKLGDLKALAKTYGGFDKIPTSNREYVEYLKRDVEVSRDLVKVIEINDYAIREHKIAAVASTISLQGFRIDIDLLKTRIREGEEKRLQILTDLMEYGLPGPDTSKSPHRTNAGIAAINSAFQKLGIELPKTPTGRPSLGKETLLAIVGSADDTSEATDLAEAVMSLNGIRSIYGNILDNLVGDKVHPSINLRQSSGRWSIQNPGLTVVGKRGGKVRERAVFLPDTEDHVLISCDLSQVDARAVAALSQDTEYMKLFEPGRDMHTEMAIRLFGSADHRERAKAASHGINYSMQAKKLALTTGMSELEASDFITGFEANFPVLVDWQQRARLIGETTGVLYNGYGRLLRIEPERSFTQSPALLGQSTARDILCEGILRLWDMGGEDIVRMIRGVIHDEVVMSVSIRDTKEVEDLVVKALSFEWCPEGGKYPIQIIAGLNKPGKNWAACYDK